MNEIEGKGMDEDYDPADRADPADPTILAARALPRGIAPARDLWPAIETAISRQRQPAGWQWNRVFAQAAAVVLLVGGSSGVTWLAMQQDGEAGLAIQATEPLRVEQVSGSFGGRYHLGPEFIEARNNLASRLDVELMRLPPATRAAVMKNIAVIRAAIDEINVALADEPDNALLQDLLLNAYRDELSLMRKVDGIANTVVSRKDI